MNIDPTLQPLIEALIAYQEDQETLTPLVEKAQDVLGPEWTSFIQTSLDTMTGVDEPTKEIKYHQIIALSNANEFDGIISGFIFDFRNDGTYWMHIKDFLNFLENSSKKSINIEDVKTYNGFEIQRKKMITNYKYDIRDMLVHILKE